MQEICQSGSEGGAKLTFVPTPIADLFVLHRWLTRNAPVCTAMNSAQTPSDLEKFGHQI